MLKIILACCVFISISVQAQTYVQINGVSWHDRSGYNSFNYGAGIEQTVSTNWTVAGGWYRNSDYRGSTYAYGRYALYRHNQWNIGLAVGAVTGYQRASVVPMVFPEVCYGWVCMLAAPRVESTGANVVAARLRIPIK